MNRNAISKCLNKKCASCKNTFSKDRFLRRDREWETCNKCSTKAALRRKVDYMLFYNDLGQRMVGLYIGQPFGQEPRQQQPVKRQPLEQQVSVSQPFNQMSAFESFPEAGIGPSLDVLRDYELLNSSFHCDHVYDGEAPVGYNFDTILGLGDKKIDFDQCLADLGLDINGFERVDSTFLQDQTEPVPSSYEMEAIIDIEGTNLTPAQEHVLPSIASELQFPAQATAKRVGKNRSKPVPSFIGDFFADINVSHDILRQPITPPDELTGEALAAHLTSELVLAIRLTEVHRRWHGMKRGDWQREVQSLIRIEEDEFITPWATLSDWFVMYEVDLEGVLDYTKTPSMSLTNRKFAKGYFKQKVLGDLKNEAVTKIEKTTEALLKHFGDYPPYTEAEVKIELDRQLSFLNSAVVEDCKVNGCLGLKTVFSRLYMDKFSKTWTLDVQGSQTPNV
jgi:hypothetical protein